MDKTKLVRQNFDEEKILPVVISSFDFKYFLWADNTFSCIFWCVQLEGHSRPFLRGGTPDCSPHPIQSTLVERFIGFFKHSGLAKALLLAALVAVTLLHSPGAALAQAHGGHSDHGDIHEHSHAHAHAHGHGHDGGGGGGGSALAKLLWAFAPLQEAMKAHPYPAAVAATALVSCSSFFVMPLLPFIGEQSLSAGCGARGAAAAAAAAAGGG